MKLMNNNSSGAWKELVILCRWYDIEFWRRPTVLHRYILFTTPWVQPTEQNAFYQYDVLISAILLTIEAQCKDPNRSSCAQVVKVYGRLDTGKLVIVVVVDRRDNNSVTVICCNII